MPNKALLQPMDDTPAQICFADFDGGAGAFPGTLGSDELREGTDTEVDLELLNLADTAAAQSDKADLGAHFAERYACVAAIEMQIAAATAGAVVEFYWNASASATAATGNMGGTSGTAGAFTGYDGTDLAQAVQQLIYIGSMVMSDEAVDSLQIGYVGDLYPPHRYGSLVVKNECGATICDTLDDKAHIVLNPIVPELQ